MAKCKACGTRTKSDKLIYCYGRYICPVCKGHVDLAVTVIKRIDREESRCIESLTK
jgi:hypothetical protein